MAYIPVEDTVMAELFLRLQGESCENTLYFTNPGGWTTVSMTALAAALATWWEDDIAVLLSNELSLVEIKVTDLASQFAPAINYPISPAITGANAVDPLPNNVAVVVRFYTEARGRSFRGRNYVPGLPDTSANGNTILATIPEAFVTGYAALSDVETSQSCSHVVVSRFSNNAPRVAGLNTEVTSYACDDTVRTQRRRLPR